MGPVACSAASLVASGAVSYQRPVLDDGCDHDHDHDRDHDNDYDREADGRSIRCC